MALPIIATGLFSFIGSIVGKFLTDGLLRYVAYKALAVTLFITILPILLKNFIVWIVQELNTVISSVMAGSSVEATVLELTGLAAWLADCFNVVDCFSLLITALAIRFVLNMIPFVG